MTSEPTAAVVEVDTTPPPLPTPAISTLKFNDYLDFVDDGSFPLLTEEERIPFRAHYRAVTGGEPPASHRPSNEQLSALKARLSQGRTPFADFSVFGSFNRRTAYLRKFDDQVLVDGAWTRKPLRGPSCFAAWESCWNIFKVAMIALDEAPLKFSTTTPGD